MIRGLKMKKMNGKNKGKLLVHIILIIGSIWMIFPFFWMVLTSFKTFSETTRIPPVIFPKSFSFANYTTVFLTLPFKQFYINTIITSFTVTIGQIIVSTMAAYVFARLKFPGNKILFFIVLSVMMVPTQIFIIPQYMTMKYLHLLDSLPALIIPGWFSAFSVFLLRQFFMTLPIELEEAARIEGCGTFKIFYSIMLPLAKPGIVAASIFSILWSWNDLMWPLIVNNSMEKMTLAAGLASLQGQHLTNYPVIMAGAFLAVLPMLIIFLIFQKQFVEGIALSGTKA